MELFERNRDMPKKIWLGFIVAVMMSLVVALYGCGGGNEKSQTEDTTTEAVEVVVKDSVNDYTWEELSAISAEISSAQSEDEAIKVAKSYNLTTTAGKLTGEQTKTVQLSNGQTTEVQIAGFWHDEKVSGGKAGITFIFNEAIDEEVMDSSDSISGGWKNSDLREWLAGNGFRMLPSDLSSKILEVNKKTNNAGFTDSASSVTSTSDKLWLFSLVELYGSYDWFVPSLAQYSGVLNAEGSEYKLFRDKAVSAREKNSVLEKTYDSDLYPWWTRSPNPDSSSFYGIVEEDGKDWENAHAKYYAAVVPGFCI